MACCRVETPHLRTDSAIRATPGQLVLSESTTVTVSPGPDAPVEGGPTEPAKDPGVTTNEAKAGLAGLEDELRHWGGGRMNREGPSLAASRRISQRPAGRPRARLSPDRPIAGQAIKRHSRSRGNLLRCAKSDSSRHHFVVLPCTVSSSAQHWR